MYLQPSNQKKLYGLNNELIELINLYKNNKLPNKILLSGQKGVGKSTLAYHLINFILSQNEDFSYDLNNFSINPENKTFKLIQNKSNPNFILIDVVKDKQNIDISQIRNLKKDLEKTSFNNKPKFVLIDNIEFLNVNSINSLLKILEEPPINTYFLLINSEKKILPTLRSRCLNFRIFLSNQKSINIINQILGSDINDVINLDLLNYYNTPGKIYNLLNLANENNIDLSTVNLDKFLSLLIDETNYKKINSLKLLIYEFIEIYLIKRINPKNYLFVNNFFKKIKDTRKFNLDDETLFIEFKTKVLNG